MDMSTAWGRWKAIPSQTKLIWLFGAFMLSIAAALFLRPNNPVANYWATTYGVNWDVVALLLMLGAFSLPVFWYLFQRIEALAIPTAPLLGIIFGLFDQLARSSTAPLVHGVVAFYVIVMFIATFYLAKELEEEKTARKKLTQTTIKE